MFTKKAYKYVLNFWFSLFLSIAMSTVMTYVSLGFISYPGIIINIIEGFVIAYIAGIVLPINKWADGFAEKCKTRRGTLPFRLFSTMILTLYFVTIMSFAFTALAIGFPPYYLIAVVSGMPLAGAVGYIVALLVTPLALKLTDAMTNKTIKELK